MDKNNLEVLKEFNKAIKMGEDSYSLVIEKVKDESFKKVINYFICSSFSFWNSYSNYWI